MDGSYRKENKLYITALSVFSSYAVVMLHANGVFWSFSYDRYWRTANIIECFFYFAVPVFFMITGANLIDYRERYGTKEFFKKRIQKTVIPFLIWNTVSVLADLKDTLNEIDLKDIVNKMCETHGYVGGYTGSFQHYLQYI